MKRKKQKARKLRTGSKKSTNSLRRLSLTEILFYFSFYLFVTVYQTVKILFIRMSDKSNFVGYPDPGSLLFDNVANYNLCSKHFQRWLCEGKVFFGLTARQLEREQTL